MISIIINDYQQAPPNVTVQHRQGHRVGDVFIFDLRQQHAHAHARTHTHAHAHDKQTSKHLCSGKGLILFCFCTNKYKTSSTSVPWAGKGLILYRMPRYIMYRSSHACHSKCLAVGLGVRKFRKDTEIQTCDHRVQLPRQGRALLHICVYVHVYIPWSSTLISEQKSIT